MPFSLATVLQLLHDPILLIQTVGYIGIFAIIFAETGLLFGFFLPGDSLLVSAGLIAAEGSLSVVKLILLSCIAAIIGDAVGYFIGRQLGSKLYHQKDSFLFRKKHIDVARDYYEEHGGKTIVFARFIPIIRTFAPTVAGAAKMSYLKFSLFNVAGGIFWVFATVLGGYYLGKAFGEKIQEYIHFIIIGIIFVSILPLLIKWIQTRKSK